MEKHEVRAIAEEMKLPIYNKPDSQEICFVPDQDYASLVRRKAPDAVRAGEFAMTDGSIVGQHEGHQHFTIGQRKGVGVAFGRPIYVVDIDPHSNRVTLGPKTDLMRRELLARDVNWFGPIPAANAAPIHCTAKIRYNSEPRPAMASFDGAGALVVRFDEPQSAITPGQAVVIYQGDAVLGGGWIEHSRD
jgi:tRNA-specific 2-thiouridylase